VVKGKWAIDDAKRPTIRPPNNDVTGPRSVHDEVIEDFEAATPVKVDANDLIGTVAFDSQFRMSDPLIVGKLKNGAKLPIPLNGKIVEGRIEVRCLDCRVCATGNCLVVLVPVSGHLIGVILFDLLALGQVGVLIGPNSVHVTGANQKENALRVGNPWRGSQEQGRCREDQSFCLVLHFFRYLPFKTTRA
jgi:hypothetical protein